MNCTEVEAYKSSLKVMPFAMWLWLPFWLNHLTRLKQNLAGGGEPAPCGPDLDTDATKLDSTGADRGEQGPVPRGAETVYVRKGLIGVNL